MTTFGGFLRKIPSQYEKNQVGQCIFASWCPKKKRVIPSVGEASRE